MVEGKGEAERGGLGQAITSSGLIKNAVRSVDSDACCTNSGRNKADVHNSVTCTTHHRSGHERNVLVTSMVREVKAPSPA